MDVWVLPKCIRKCDIVFRGVWARARRGERVVSFKSPGPCVATLLNQLTPLVRGHSSAGLLQPAPGGVIWGLSWCLTHCSTSTHSGYGLTPPLGSRRTVNLQQSKVNCDADGHGCNTKCHLELNMELQLLPLRRHTQLRATMDMPLLLLSHLFDILAANCWSFFMELGRCFAVFEGQGCAKAFPLKLVHFFPPQ